MNIMTEKIGQYQINDIFFKLPLYIKIKIEMKPCRTSTEYNDLENGEMMPVGYDVYCKNDINSIVKMIQEKYTIYGKCPCCKKDTSMIAFENKEMANKKLLNKILWSYGEGEWEFEDFVDLTDYRLNKYIDKLCNNGGYYEKNFQYPMCKNIYSSLFCLQKSEEELIVQKIGQYPSMRDFSSNYSNRFIKDLKKQQLDVEYVDALNTHDAGYNIASFVYLRRIIERIIISKFDENKLGITMAEFNAKHFEEKLQCLRADLPEQLQDKKLYEITSAGIHSLSEEDCSRYFEPLKNAIELILIEEEKKSKQLRMKAELDNSLGNICKEIKQTHDANTSI